MAAKNSLSGAFFRAALRSRPLHSSHLLAVHYLTQARASELGLVLPFDSGLGLIIGKRFAKRAVWRHAIKRQIRESYRLTQPADGFWVVRLRASVAPWSRSKKRQVRQEIDDIMRANKVD